jgi:Bacterial Ig-like domain (group 1)
MSRPFRAILPLALAALFVACGGGDLALPSAPPDAAIQMVNGNGQVGPPAALLPNPLIVRLVDAAGAGIPNRTVLWVLKSQGGSVSPTTGMTDAEGYASAEWTLASEPGSNSVQAQVPGVGSVTFTATGREGAPGGQPSPSASTVVANPDTIVAGQTSTLSVTVLDDQGRPVEGALVTLAATGDGNTLGQPSAPTDAAGLATGTLQSTVPGDKVVTVTVNDVVPLAQQVTITVTASEQQVDHLIFQTQPHDVKKKDTFRVAVALADANGAIVPLSGVFIYLDLFPDGSSVPDNQRLRGEHFENTDANGIAEFDIRVEEEGSYRIRALTDDLPELGPHGPEPYLFSELFRVD